MSKIDEIIEFLTNDLNTKISNKKRDLINNKFYPDIIIKFIGQLIFMNEQVNFFMKVL